MPSNDRKARTLLLITAAILLALVWYFDGSRHAAAQQSPTPDPAVEDFVPSEQLPTDSAISFPVDESGHFNWRSEKVHRCEVHQLRYDGKRFTAVRSFSGLESAHPAVGDSVWQIIAPGITNAIPDGDDLLQPVTASGTRQVTGVLRWARKADPWVPVEFTPVTSAAPSR